MNPKPNELQKAIEQYRTDYSKEYQESDDKSKKLQREDDGYGFNFFAGRASGLAHRDIFICNVIKSAEATAKQLEQMEQERDALKESLHYANGVADLGIKYRSETEPQLVQLKVALKNLHAVSQEFFDVLIAQANHRSVPVTNYHDLMRRLQEALSASAPPRLNSPSFSPLPSVNQTTKP